MSTSARKSNITIALEIEPSKKQIGSERNCIVNFTSKTITFWWSNEENKNVLGCGLMDSDAHFIEGNTKETGKVSLS